MKKEAIEKLVAEQLTLAYVQAGKSIAKNTVVVVANSLADALGFSDENEVRETFRRAKDMADIPTQRVLKEALANHRAESIAYVPPQTETPRIGYVGSRIPSHDEKMYILATQRLAGLYPYMKAEDAKRIAEEFEADPKNRDFVDYQRGWIYRNARKFHEMAQKLATLRMNGMKRSA